MDKNIINQVKNYILLNETQSLDLFIEKNSKDISVLNQIFFLIYELTNSFRNTNTTKELMKTTSKLLDYGVVHDKIIVEKTKLELDKMKLFGEVLSFVIRNRQGNIIGATLEKELFDKYNIDFFSLNELIDQLLFSIKDVEVVFFCIRDDEKLKIVRFKNKKTKELQKLICNFETDSMACNSEINNSCMKCCNF